MPSSSLQADMKVMRRIRSNDIKKVKMVFFMAETPEKCGVEIIGLFRYQTSESEIPFGKKQPDLFD